MKKIMTALLCAVGFSLVSQAEKISGTNFEALEVDANVVGKTDAGQEGQGYWSGEGVDALIATNTFTAVEVQPEEGEPYTNYVQNIAPYTGAVGYPTVHDEAQTSEKFLSINTKGGELVRNIQEGGTAQSIGDGIYFDSMVQFTATDALDANAGSETDKLILWLRDNGDGTTNLVVTAGKLGPTGNATSFDYIITNEVQADKWYRLTIQAIANAVNDGDNAYTCYAIYIDGVKAEYSVSDVAFDGEGARTFTVQAPYSGYLYNGSVHALFPNLLGKSNEATNFTAVAFSGVGAVDDIEFTRTAPDFANPPASLTVEWTVGVNTVTITPGEGEAIVIAANGVGGSTNITDKGTYTIAATVQTGYVAATVSQSEVTVENTEVTVSVSTEEGYAEINGKLYASLADAITAAQNGDTVKLYKGKDLGSAPLAIDNENAFVLDLNGQVLSGSHSDGVLSVGNALTIIDSIGGGAVSNTTDGAVAVLVDGGSLVIGYAENDMGASFFGSVGAANDVETISIVRGNFYGFGEISPAGYVAPGSVGNMVENCYVVAPDTNTYVAQIGSTKYETLTNAVEAAQNGDTVNVLTNCAAERVTISKNITINLGGFTYTGRLSMFDGNVVVTNGTVAGRFDVYDSSVVTLAADAMVDGCVVVWGDGTYGQAGCKTPTFNLYGTIDGGNDVALLNGEGDVSQPNINVFPGATIKSGTTSYAVVMREANFTMTGGTVESDWALWATNSVITVSGGTINGGNRAIDANGSTVALSGGAINADDSGIGLWVGSTLTMTGGSIVSGDFGIFNNGLEASATTMTISGGTITSTNGTACAIYQAGLGSLTISGTAVVSGPDAVEVRAGTVQVLGDAQLVATAAYSAPASNGSGNSGHGGVALLVSQHTTAQNVAATVSGGILQGAVAFQEATVETQNDASKVAGVIAGGAILGEVKSENLEDLIPSTSTAQFSDSNADGVEAGYELVLDQETSLYKVSVVNYTLTYVTAQGTAPAAVVYTVESNDFALAAAPVVEGYTFLGWVIGTTTNEAAATFVVADNLANTTATAAWEQNAPAAPVVDGQTVVPGEEFDTATTEKPITYPSTATVTGEVGNQTITYGTSGSVKVPEYYTASAEGNVVSLALNNNALPEIDEAVIAEETKPAMEVTDNATTVTLKATNPKLYYGLATADSANTPKDDYVVPATLTKGNGDAMQITISVGSNETSKFYRVYVTDIVPPQSGN